MRNIVCARKENAPHAQVARTEEEPVSHKQPVLSISGLLEDKYNAGENPIIIPIHLKENVINLFRNTMSISSIEIDRLVQDGITQLEAIKELNKVDANKLYFCGPAGPVKIIFAEEK